jgi:hypothetical protein
MHLTATGPDPQVREEAEARAIEQSPRQLARVIDYLLITTHDQGGATPAGHDGPVSLPRGIRIEKLDHELTERLLDAATLRGEDWHPTRQFSVVHAYVRTVWDRHGTADPPEQLYSWDSGRCLYPCAQLSKLIRDNATGTEFALRRLIRADGGERIVPFDGFETHVAYRLYPDQRGWLDIDEAHSLAGLLTAFWEGPVRPPRVGHALRRVDSVTGERYLQDALPITVGGLESLLKVGRDWVTAQFSKRVPQLAAEVGIEGLNEERCRDLYSDRSALVHGTEVDLSGPVELDEFGQCFIALQETLRRTVRRAIEDPGFAARFQTDEVIKDTWPASVTHRGQLVSI